MRVLRSCNPTERAHSGSVMERKHLRTPVATHRANFDEDGGLKTLEKRAGAAMHAVQSDH